MKIKVDSNTTPITSDILATKTFSFNSGSTGGAITRQQMEDIITALGNSLGSDMSAQRIQLAADLSASINSAADRIITAINNHP